MNLIPMTSLADDPYIHHYETKSKRVHRLNAACNTANLPVKCAEHLADMSKPGWLHEAHVVYPQRDDQGWSPYLQAA